LDLIRRVHFAYPGDFWANEDLGWILLETGNQAESIRYFTAALALCPDNPGVLLNRGIALTDAGESEAAAADLQRAVTLAPQYLAAHRAYAAAYRAIGTALGRQKKLEEAIAAFRKSVEIAEEYFLNSDDNNWAKEVTGHDARLAGFSLDDLKLHAEAEEMFRKAVKVFEDLSAKEPDNPSHQHFLADTYAFIGKVRVAAKRVQDGEKAYRLAIEIHERRETRFPDFHRFGSPLVFCYLDLASLLASSNRGEEALALYQRALERSPNEALVNNRFAWFLATCPGAGLREPAQALQLAKKAMQLSPANYSFSLDAPYLHAGTNWTTLGVAHYRAGEWKEAVAALQKSMELRKGGDSTDWFFLAMAHWKLGDKDKARESYNQAVQWMDTNQPKNEVRLVHDFGLKHVQWLATNQLKNEEVRRFRAEAVELLGLNEK
jgi:tetratricopeptide (TPR) repeat protein